MVDRSGNILDFRETGSAPLYLPPKEFLGKDVSQVLPSEVAQGAEESITRVVTTQEPVEYEYELLVTGTPAYFHAYMVL